MSLTGILSNAASGIAASSNAMAVIGNNVARAGVTDYVRERAVQGTQTAGGVGDGVRVGATQRDLDLALQRATFAQNATVAGLQTTQTALAGIDSVQGSTGAGNDLSSLVGKLQDAFTTLSDDPANQAQQSAVLGAAGAVAGQLNTLSATVAGARQTAQDDAVGAVADANAAIATIGTLGQQIVRLQQAGQSTADLESQRDAALDTLGAILPVTVVRQASGDVALFTQGGAQLQTSGGAALTLAPSSLATGPAAAAAPGVKVAGIDVTATLKGGRLGADLVLRDTTLPGYQAGLDEFARTLSAGLGQQGMKLFTDQAGTVPAAAAGGPVQAGYLGYAGVIQVNPAATQGGLSSIATTPLGGAGGGAVVNQALVAFTGPVPAMSTTGLGASGTLFLPYAQPATLGAFATALVGAMSGDAAAATGRLATETAVQTTLQGRLSSRSGVSIDDEMTQMVQIQNAYAANGKVISAVQAMWSATLAMVPG